MLINELAPPSPSLCLNLITGLAFKRTLPSPANEFGTCVENKVGHLDYTLPLPWDSPVTLQGQAEPHRATPTQVSPITLTFTTSGEKRKTLSHPLPQGIYSAPTHAGGMNRDQDILPDPIKHVPANGMNQVQVALERYSSVVIPM